MSFRYRPLRREDVPACIHMLAEHPILGSRFGTAANLLEAAFALAWTLDSVISVALEERLPNGQARFLGAGLVGFVTDEFLARLKTPPFFWIGPEVTRLMVAGRSPFLSNEQLKTANSSGGLNTVTWLYLLNLAEMQRFEVQRVAMDAYRCMLRGYRLKEIIGQTTVPEELLAALHSGGLLLGPDGLPLKDAPHSPEKVASKPHVLSMSRDLLPQYLGTWTSLMFTYQEPLLGFARSEQRLLDAALLGVTDEELATELKISLSAVKKTWRSIYTRVSRSSTGILPGTLETRTDSSDRGKGKKHRILTYVREHPEELRPVCLKLVHRPPAKNSDGTLPTQRVPRQRSRFLGEE